MISLYSHSDSDDQDINESVYIQGHPNMCVWTQSSMKPRYSTDLKTAWEEWANVDGAATID